MDNTNNSDRNPININLVVQMLTEEGKSRREIQEFYGLNGAEAKILFTHDKVKGLKTKRKPNIVIVDEPLVEPTEPAYIRESPRAEASFVN